MTKLSIRPSSRYDASIGEFDKRTKRRVEITPPGTCPVAAVLADVEVSAAQTCGKCVPCRYGLSEIAGMLRAIQDGSASPSAIDALRTTAEVVRDSADCAIGYQAAEDVLSAMDMFADEFQAHLETGTCSQEVGQKVPCEAMCPAHVDIPGYIALVEEGRCDEAIRLIRKDNPFPTMCAMVCERPCETRCRRMLLDAPVNIRGIKKFAVDSVAADKVEVPRRHPDTGRRVAVVGGGPSGMTCAYFLALMGHGVTVFEARKELGGMTRYGIPAYRFPRQRLDEDLRAVLSVGNIDVKLETKVDAEKMKGIFEEFDAAYVAIGAQAGKKLALEGADSEGVMSAVDMLGRIGDGEYPDFTGKKVAVIGGGNVAMDCCRTAVRAGAAEVSCVYRRRLADMTALPEEVESAIAEGVEMITLEAPVSIEVDDAGRACAVITQPQMISTVKRGRPAPVDADKPRRRIEADVVLLAVGQNVVTAPFEEFGMAAEWGRFVADESLRAEGLDGVFVGGDCQTGPATVIRAIAAGKVAARNIDDHLGFDHALDCGVSAPSPHANRREACGRVEIAERPARERKGDFECVENPMSRQEAVQECGRCLRCDHYGCGVLEGGRAQYA